MQRGRGIGVLGVAVMLVGFVCGSALADETVTIGAGGLDQRRRQ
jgi:hypothetical protein